MLKKAGIVVAAAAAGLLAVSPLAFAGESAGHGHEHGYSHVKGDDKGHKGDDKGHKGHKGHDGASASATYDHSPSCDFDATNDNRVAQENSGFSALLGVIANAAAPVNAQAQAPILSCNNFSNIGNIDTENTSIGTLLG